MGDDRQIIRVFPRRTKATPEDPLAFVGSPPLFRPAAAEVHVSCTFTWDRRRAESLAREWAAFYPVVRVGGPAFGDPGGEFTPGRYLRPGYTGYARHMNMIPACLYRVKLKVGCGLREGKAQECC